MTDLFQFENAGMQYDRSVVLQSVSLTMRAGEFIAIAGPNGAGKSTLLSLMAGLIKPTLGRCCFRGKDIHRWSRRDFAQQVAVVTQSGPLAFPFNAAEVVAMGRMPYADGLFESDSDRMAIQQAMQQTGTLQFAGRHFQTLSGGEKQRVLLASALAQKPQVLLLDEPGSHLDLRHLVDLHQLLRNLSNEGILVVAITHDLNLAAAYADRLLLLDIGEVKADGRPADVLTPPMLRDVFGVNAAVCASIDGKPWLSYGPLNG